MKQVKTIAAIVAIALLLLQCFVACKRELSCEGCNEKNKPPLAKAGADKTITLPTDSVLLDGSASTDPDGKISEWRLLTIFMVVGTFTPFMILAQQNLSGNDWVCWLLFSFPWGCYPLSLILVVVTIIKSLERIKYGPGNSLQKIPCGLYLPIH
jgi:hypothetical protein